MISKVFPKIHAEGYKFLVIFGVVTLILYLISSFLGLIGLVLTIWCYYFFRDPERQSINNEEYLVSPADGEVIKVEEVNGPKELGLENKKMTKISVFMNVFDCHVNRSPCSGSISEINYVAGKFFNALWIKQARIMKEGNIKLKTLLVGCISSNSRSNCKKDCN